MKKVFLLLGFFLAMQTQASDWMVLDDDIDIDMQSVQKKYVKAKPYVGVWTRINYSYGGQAKHLRWFNCKEKTMSELPSTTIRFGKKGEMIDSKYRQLHELKFIDIPPDTVTEQSYHIACTASLMADVMSDDNVTEKDMKKLHSEYHNDQFDDFRGFILNKLYGE